MPSLSDVKYEKLECESEDVKQENSSRFLDSYVMQPKLFGAVVLFLIFLFILASFVDGRSVKSGLSYTSYSSTNRYGLLKVTLKLKF